MAKQSKDVRFVGGIKVSVVKIAGGYAVRRDDIYKKVFLQMDGKPYPTHTDAIKGVSRMVSCMIDEQLKL